MGWQFRKSKKFGGARFTISQRGLSSSIGGGPFRLSFGADGRTRRTLRIPGTGLYNVKTIGGKQRRRSNASSGSPILGLLLLGLLIYFIAHSWRVLVPLLLIIFLGLKFAQTLSVWRARQRNEVTSIADQSPSIMSEIPPMPPPPVEVQEPGIGEDLGGGFFEGFKKGWNEGLNGR